MEVKFILYTTELKSETVEENPEEILPRKT